MVGASAPGLACAQEAAGGSLTPDPSGRLNIGPPADRPQTGRLGTISAVAARPAARLVAEVATIVASLPAAPESGTIVPLLDGQIPYDYALARKRYSIAPSWPGLRRSATIRPT